MTQVWITIFGLAAATFGIRFGGFALGRRLPRHGAWARGLRALPGCLITALVMFLLLQGGPQEWIAGAIAAGVAIVSRSLPLTMAAGIIAIWCLRQGVFGV